MVQDLFLNETASYAHVFLPGSSFLEKDGTFTNAERRISRVRKAIAPMAGMADWEITHGAFERAGLSDALQPSVGNHGRDRAPDADLRRRELRKDRRAGQHSVALQREGSGRHAGDAHRRLRARQGQVHDHRIHPHRRTHHRPLPADPDHRAASCRSTTWARRRARTENNVWHPKDVLEIHPFDAENRGIKEGDLVSLASRAGDTTLHARISERMQPGVVYTTFHHAMTGANVVTTEFSDWATSCPEYKVTAVQVQLAKHMSEWQEHYREDAAS